MQSFSFPFLILNVIGNTLWTSYANKLHNFDMMVPNFIGKKNLKSNVNFSIYAGIFFSTYMICVALSVCFTPQKLMSAVFFIGWAFASMSPLVSASVCGSMGTCLSIMTSISTLTQAPLVVQSRNASFMNFPFIISSLVNFFFWWSYAILTKDVIYFTSQFFGFMCMAFNIIIYMWA